MWHVFKPVSPPSHWLIFKGGPSLAADWHLSPHVRGACTSSSSLTRTLPAGCVCCSWLYSSPFVSAGFTVRLFSSLTVTCSDYISPLPSTGRPAEVHIYFVLKRRFGSIWFGRFGSSTLMTELHCWSFLTQKWSPANMFRCWRILWIMNEQHVNKYFE